MHVIGVYLNDLGGAQKEHLPSIHCSPGCWLGVSGNQAALAAEHLSSPPARRALASGTCGFLAYLCFLRVADSLPSRCLSSSGCLALFMCFFPRSQPPTSDAVLFFAKTVAAHCKHIFLAFSGFCYLWE